MLRGVVITTAEGWKSFLTRRRELIKEQLCQKIRVSGNALQALSFPIPLGIEVLALLDHSGLQLLALLWQPWKNSVVGNIIRVGASCSFARAQPILKHLGIVSGGLQDSMAGIHLKTHFIQWGRILIMLQTAPRAEHGILQ